MVSFCHFRQKQNLLVELPRENIRAGLYAHCREEGL